MGKTYATEHVPLNPFLADFSDDASGYYGSPIHSAGYYGTPIHSAGYYGEPLHSQLLRKSRTFLFNSRHTHTRTATNGFGSAQLKLSG